LLLSASWIAAIGFSSNALWIVPVLSAFVGLSMIRASQLRERLRGGWLVVVPGLYVAFLMHFMRSRMADVRLPTQEALRPAGENLEDLLSFSLGESQLLALAVFSLGFSWCLAPNHLVARLSSRLPLLALLTLLNPYTLHWTASVVGPSTWRALWLIPLPLLMATLLGGLARGFTSRLSKRCSPAISSLAAATILILFLTHVSPITSFGQDNGVEISAPRLKFRRPALGVATAVRDALEPGLLVAAPDHINVVLATMRGRPDLVSLRRYLRRHREVVGRERALDREQLSEYSDGRIRPNRGPQVRELLEQVKPDAILVRMRAGQFAWTQRFMIDSGYQRILNLGEYSLFARKELSLSPATRPTISPGFGPAPPGRPLWQHR
jgi:hypothetical protein